MQGPFDPSDSLPNLIGVNPMKVTYYLEMVSSWCHWAEPTWAELKRRYAGRAEFDWRIALMRPEDFPASEAENDWYYRRSGTIMKSTYKLNPSWLEPELKGDYSAADLVAEAARDYGFTDDRVRLALSHAAMIEGCRIGRLEEASRVASEASGIEASRLAFRAQSTEVRARVETSTAEFYSHGITQRPAFVLVDDIGDKAVFSGLVRLEPIAAAIEAMLADTNAYRSWEAHFGSPPKE